MGIKTLSTELIQFGVSHSMQDFYLLPKKTHYEFSFRSGPFFYGRSCVSESVGSQLISRFKYLGQMDVSEKRKAQLGAISYPLAKEIQRLRLSTVGDYQQRESLVIRFLHIFGSSQEVFWLPNQLEVVRRYCRNKGLYLFCGPVGSGKTTLMYKLAKECTGQVITIEDPVEIEEPNFLQLQINEKISQTYDELIKLSLRHHPDVLIIGEIRDKITMQGAIRAALTGHCVFATLHASSLENAQSRILELGGEKSLLEDCLRGIIYQEMLTIEKKAGLLMSYRFFEENCSFTWEEGMKALDDQKD
ncbi:secretion system protein E [Enterococcus florum]|uniref:Secretion system protein E n=1 Tax=Enterococcus florum TaxID=2480627 RepID=A0A4V0WPU2_9ENTE|nr:competence type IV pilus ATPase ComGA [Enterococcus florum]GCF95049.1 secretion system protein E [Enterococcus florum]